MGSHKESVIENFNIYDVIECILTRFGLLPCSTFLVPVMLP